MGPSRERSAGVPLRPMGAASSPTDDSRKRLPSLDNKVQDLVSADRIILETTGSKIIRGEFMRNPNSHCWPGSQRMRSSWEHSVSSAEFVMILNTPEGAAALAAAEGSTTNCSKTDGSLTTGTAVLGRGGRRASGCITIPIAGGAVVWQALATIVCPRCEQQRGVAGLILRRHSPQGATLECAGALQPLSLDRRHVRDG